MIDSNLKQIYFIKIIQTTGSHSLIIDLSNDVFFHVFIIFLQKFRRLNGRHRIETLERGPVKIEACIGGYQISQIPGSKQASIPYKLANIPIINFPKYSISLKVAQILNTVSYIPGSKMESILYPWK